jgi:cobaltochelatase CobS
MRTNEEIRVYLLQVGIFQINDGARAVGFSFKNGLKKAEIIDGVISAGLGEALISWVIRQGTRAPLPMETPETTIIESTPTMAPIQAPDNQAAALAAILQSILSRPAGLDVPAVQAMIDASLKGVDFGFTTTIQVDTAPPVVLEERTHYLFPKLLRKLGAKLHVIIVGGAGGGKSHAAEQAARALNMRFFSIGAASFAHELIGYRDATREYARTDFREAFENGGLLVIEEADASAADAMLVLNNMLANGYGAFPDGHVKMSDGFLCVCCTNTDGSGATMQYSGRQRLDGAFLDRFVNQEWAIDPAIEKGDCGGHTAWLLAVRAVREYAEQNSILDVVATPRAVKFGAKLLQAGEEKDEVLRSCLKRGALSAQWDNVLTIPAVADFLTGF